MSEAIYEDSNMVAGFVSDCIEYNPNRMVSVPDFCAAFSVWFVEQRGEDRKMPSNNQIGEAIGALGDKRIGTHKKELRDNKRRYYAGIMLNDAGLEYWQQASMSNMFDAKKTGLSSNETQVNALIPISWDAKPSIQVMRKAHEQAAGTRKNGSRKSTRKMAVTTMIEAVVTRCHFRACCHGRNQTVTTVGCHQATVVTTVVTDVKHLTTHQDHRLSDKGDNENSLEP